MRRRGLLTIILLQCLVLLSGCSQGEKVSYKRVEEVYVLERFEGGVEDTYLAIDTYEGEPVVAISDFALANREYLEEIYIGESVEEISPWAMTNCKNLKTITVHPDNPRYTSIDGVLYTKDLSTLLVYPNKNQESHYTIPEGVTTISDNAFYKCTQIESVTLPSTLLIIEDMAFHKCINLVHIQLPQGLQYIGRDSFAHCIQIEEIVIPNSVETVEEYAFFGWKETQQIVNNK